MSDTFDDDLPEAPVEPAKRPTPPQDPVTKRFVSPKAPQPPAPEPTPPPVSSYVLTRARRLGIPNPEQMDAATLESWLTWADAREQQRQPEPPKPPVEEPEPPFDWGEDDEGKLTDERLKAENPRLFRLKEYVDRKMVEAQKPAKKALDHIEQQNQARALRAFQREVAKRLAAHPEMFGEKPLEATGVEKERVQAVFGRLAQIGQENNRQTLDHLDEDVGRAMALFVPAGERPPGSQPPRPKDGATPPRKAPAAGPYGVADYRDAEAARPTDRRNLTQLSKRELMLKQEAERLRENGVAVAPDFGEDDDDDLMESH